MRIDDPTRPYVGDYRAYCREGLSGPKAIAAIPRFELYQFEGAWFLGAWLVYQPGTARRYEREIGIEQLEALIAEFEASPEEFYREKLGWSWREGAEPGQEPQSEKQISSMTAEEAGL